MILNKVKKLKINYYNISNIIIKTNRNYIIKNFDIKNKIYNNILLLIKKIIYEYKNFN